jgi:small subunit ribosomal protein S7
MAEQEQIEQKAEAKQTANSYKLFDLYDVSSVKAKDAALVPYINLSAKIMVKSHGRNIEKFGNAKINIIERMANRMGVAGHVGKKHKIITNWSTGKYNRNMKTMLEVLKIVEKRTGKNPIQVLVTAVENGSPRDEITVIEHAGARYPQAVDASPIRRVNLAVRWMVQGAYGKAFGKKKKMAETLAEEIIKASEGSMESFAVSRKNESEKSADSSR